jgi:serpin B
MYLINAVYFEGEWLEPFNSINDSRDFILSDNSTVSAKFMSSKKTVSYKGTPKFDAVSIPYKGEMSMILAMPTEKYTPRDLFSSNKTMEMILGQNWTYSDQVVNGRMEDSRAKIIMPKFEFQNNLDMIPILQGMGAKKAFTIDADFSKADEKNNLYINLLKQKNYIYVDEKKTISISISLGGLANKSAGDSSPIITFDRPFIFAIVDKQGVPYFMGVVENPIGS